MGCGPKTRVCASAATLNLLQVDMHVICFGTYCTNNIMTGICIYIHGMRVNFKNHMLGKQNCLDVFHEVYKGQQLLARHDTRLRQHVVSVINYIFVGMTRKRAVVLLLRLVVALFLVALFVLLATLVTKRSESKDTGKINGENDPEEDKDGNHDPEPTVIGIGVGLTVSTSNDAVTA